MRETHAPDSLGEVRQRNGAKRWFVSYHTRPTETFLTGFAIGFLPLHADKDAGIALMKSVTVPPWSD